MKNFKFSKGFRFFAVIGLAIIIIGAFMLGFLGMNGDSYYKGAYELEITADQNFYKEDIKKTVESKIKEDGVRVISVSELDDGSTIIYELNKEMSRDAVSAVKNILEQDFTGVEFETVACYKTETPDSGNKIFDGKEALFLSIAILVTVILLTVYFMFRYKFAAAFTVLCSALCSALLYTAIYAVTRLVFTRAFFATLAVSVLFTVVLSTLFVNGVKDIKENFTSASDEVLKKQFKLNLITLIALSVFGLFAIIIGTPTIKWAGVGLIIAGIVAVLTNLFMTGFIWSAFKKISFKGTKSVKQNND